jgi:hypothetical protein
MRKKNKGKIGLIFTLDYEIHGNGSGEFKNWAFLPTSQMLDLFDEYGAKLTIMAEMGHYWAMKRYIDLFSDDVLLFESQLKDAIRRGHDVQFHFHPQWINSTFENGEWKLDFSRKTIGQLCHQYEDAVFYLKKGQTELQNLLTPIDPDYKCNCFRAGFLQMNPYEIIQKALVDSGFESDSSVSKGMKAENSLISIDYTSAFSRYFPWKTSQININQSDDNGKILEFPILSDNVGFIEKIIGKIIKLKGERNIGTVVAGLMDAYGRGMMPKNNSTTILDRITRMISPKWFYVDFCKEDHANLNKYIKKVVSDCNKNNNSGFVPVVLIGHSKDFFFNNNLSMFLQSCMKIDGLEFITYSSAVEKFKYENPEKAS